MSGYYEQPDPSEELGSGGSGLRKMLEETLAENKRLLARLEGEDRQAAATAALKGAGLNPAVAKLIPADADPQKWVEENRSLFGSAPAQQEPEELPSNTVVAPELDAAVLAEQQALEDMQQAQQDGSPSAVVANDLLEQLNKFDGTKTEDDLLRFLASNGMGTIPSE